MSRYIVITSIFEPTVAVRSFSMMKDYKLIVVGDKKTPLGWHCDNVDYMGIDTQENSKFTLADMLPFNHYCRKMLGYLTAMENGAGYIVDTDDDNIPKNNWQFPGFDNTFDCIGENKGFVNMYQLYTDQKIWPRGLPLNLVSKQFNLDNCLENKECKIGVWQGLADEDPDVDAIYRLTCDTPCYFKDRGPVVLGKGTLSPFNSQNTLIRKELFPLLYLPTYATFRFTDILRSLVAQPIMWLYNYQLGFANATVVQKRNPHDYMKDFISEIPMYQFSEEVIEAVSKVVHATDSIETNLYNAYHELLKRKMVCEKEMQTLESWIRDLGNIDFVLVNKDEVNGND